MPPPAHCRSECRNSRWTLTHNTSQRLDRKEMHWWDRDWVVFNIKLWTIEQKQHAVDRLHLTASLTLSFLRVIWVSWVSCWCRAHSACGRSTRKVMPKLRTWPVSSPCRGTSSSTRRPCSSARGGRRTGKATRKLPHTASNNLWMWAPPRLQCWEFCSVCLQYCHLLFIFINYILLSF